MALIKETYLWQCPKCKRVKVSKGRFEFLKMSLEKCKFCNIRWVLKG